MHLHKHNISTGYYFIYRRADYNANQILASMYRESVSTLVEDDLISEIRLSDGVGHITVVTYFTQQLEGGVIAW